MAVSRLNEAEGVSRLYASGPEVLGWLVETRFVSRKSNHSSRAELEPDALLGLWPVVSGGRSGLVI